MGSRTKVEVCEIRDVTKDVRPPDLPPNVVHLWRLSLQTVADNQESCYELLSLDERDKALRYRVERPRSEFVMTRSALRSLVAHYLGSSPQMVRFRYTEHGKPILDGATGLQFNVSHTEGLALLAFACGRDLGVDVEKLHSTTDVRKLAERFFSIQEREELGKLEGEDLHAAFLRCWTRKEAYIKARGEGLSLPLDQFDVSIAPDEQNALLATRPVAEEAKWWTVCNVHVGVGYAAALAYGEELSRKE